MDRNAIHLKVWTVKAARMLLLCGTTFWKFAKLTQELDGEYVFDDTLYSSLTVSGKKIAKQLKHVLDKIGFCNGRITPSTHLCYILNSVTGIYSSDGKHYNDRPEVCNGDLARSVWRVYDCNTKWTSYFENDCPDEEDFNLLIDCFNGMSECELLKKYSPFRADKLIGCPRNQFEIEIERYRKKAVQD